jgi:hypothetical protein
MNQKLGGQNISGQKVNNQEQLATQVQETFQTQEGNQGLGHGHQGLGQHANQGSGQLGHVEVNPNQDVNAGIRSHHTQAQNEKGQRGGDSVTEGFKQGDFLQNKNQASGK